MSQTQEGTAALDYFPVFVRESALAFHLGFPEGDHDETPQIVSEVAVPEELRERFFLPTTAEESFASLSQLNGMVSGFVVSLDAYFFGQSSATPLGIQASPGITQEELGARLGDELQSRDVEPSGHLIMGLDTCRWLLEERPSSHCLDDDRHLRLLVTSVYEKIGTSAVWECAYFVPKPKEGADGPTPWASVHFSAVDGVLTFKAGGLSGLQSYKINFFTGGEGEVPGPRLLWR